MMILLNLKDFKRLNICHPVITKIYLPHHQCNRNITLCDKLFITVAVVSLQQQDENVRFAG